jgi:endo-1,4-beta-xylanase
MNHCRIVHSHAPWLFATIALLTGCSDGAPSNSRNTVENGGNGGDSANEVGGYAGETPSGGTGGESVNNNGAGGSGAASGGTGGQLSTATSAVGGNPLTTANSTVTITHPKFLGNITTGNTVDVGNLKYSTHWNQITPENAGKWGSVQGSASSGFNWTTLDAIYDYAQKNNLIFKEHAFVWGSQQPAGTITETHVKNWITNFCARYPNTKIIDVVNEPPPHSEPLYANAIGGGTGTTWQWIINSFHWARAACPNAILVLNDYNNIEYVGDAANFVYITKVIQAAGAPIDAVGVQGHSLGTGKIAFDTAKFLLDSLHQETGLPVYITEFDVSTTDDVAQLKIYQQYIPLFMETEFIKGVTIWGWIYGSTWNLAPYSGLVKSGVSRSAMNYLMDYVGRSAP